MKFQLLFVVCQNYLKNLHEQCWQMHRLQNTFENQGGHKKKKTMGGFPWKKGCMHHKSPCSASLLIYQPRPLKDARLMHDGFAGDS